MGSRILPGMGWQNHPCETTSDVSGKFVLGVGGSGSVVLGEVRFSESVVKNPPEMQEMPGDAGSIPESGRSPGGGNGDPLQYSCLGNVRDRSVPGGAPSQLQERTVEASRPVFSWALPPASPQSAFNLCPFLGETTILNATALVSLESF